MPFLPFLRDFDTTKTFCQLFRELFKEIPTYLSALPYALIFLLSSLV